MRTRLLLLLLLLLAPGYRAMAAPPDGTAAVIYVAAPCSAEQLSIVTVNATDAVENDTNDTVVSSQTTEETGADTDIESDTPSAPSSAPTASQDPLPILIINEVFPDPEGKDSEQEFIELRNLSSFTAQLNGWSIRDAKGRVFLFSNHTISESGYLALPYAETKINLTNTGFSLSLISDDGMVRDTLDVSEDAVTGQSFARTDADDWSWTPIVTKSAKNEFPIPETLPQEIIPIDEAAGSSDGTGSTADTTEPPPENADTTDGNIPDKPPLTLQELTDIPENQIVAVTGIVSLAPGRAGKTIFAMQNDEAGRGIFIRMYGSNRPTLAVGDQVLVNARIKRTNGILSLNAISGGVTVLSSLGVTATQSAINDIDDADTGILTSLRGEIIDSGKNWLLLADPEGTREITARLPDNAVTGPVIIGNTVTVQGVVRQKNGTNELLMLSRGDILVPAQDDKPSLLDSAIPAANAGREPLSIDRSATRTEAGGYLPWMLAGIAALSYVIVRIVSVFRRNRHTDARTK